jgi:hypothetical protein
MLLIGHQFEGFHLLYKEKYIKEAYSYPTE